MPVWHQRAEEGNRRGKRHAPFQDLWTRSSGRGNCIQAGRGHPSRLPIRGGVRMPPSLRPPGLAPIPRAPGATQNLARGATTVPSDGGCHWPTHKRLACGQPGALPRIRALHVRLGKARLGPELTGAAEGGRTRRFRAPGHRAVPSRRSGHRAAWPSIDGCPCTSSQPRIVAGARSRAGTRRSPSAR